VIQDLIELPFESFETKKNLKLLNKSKMEKALFDLV